MPDAAEPGRRISARQADASWGDPRTIYSAHGRIHSLDMFRAMMAGRMPHEPAMALLGVQVAEAEAGEVVLALDPAERHYDLAGAVHGGILAAITDTAAGYAIHTRLPLGGTAATLELHQNFTRPITAASGRIRCTGRVTHLGSRTAVAEAAITDAAGHLCVQMGTTMIVRPPAADGDAPLAQTTDSGGSMPDASAPARQITIDWADPAILQEAEKHLPWIDILRRMVTGELPVPPSFRLQGFIPVSVEPGEVVFALDPAEQHYNLISCVHGGILSALCDTAAGLAVHSKLPPGTTCTTLELHVNFIRPVSLDSGRATCVGKVIHLGSRTATAEARITDAKGRLCAHMGTTLMVLPIAREK